MTKFQQAVLNAVRAVPEGKIASYGQIASILGLPRAARQVGWIMRGLEGEGFPWWRVINNAGRISIKGTVEATPDLQKSLLENENVGVSANLKIDIEHFRWHPGTKTLKKLKLPDSYLEEAAKHTPFES
jgi:methylated-DNA-protein-cysteine methyltransferase related protein